jgi:endonuclease-3 related protein
VKDIQNNMSQQIGMVYRSLLDQYGPQNWWPAETRFEIVVGAILAQGTAWSNVEKAINQIKSAGAMNPKAIREMDPKLLSELIYSSGYYRTKSVRLKAVTQYLNQRFGDDIDLMKEVDVIQLRQELLGINGIGEETADDILLYVVGLPVFVVDSYTKRIFSRLGIGPEKGSYSLYQTMFMSNLEHDVNLMKEYHALIVQHASKVCRPIPLCTKCYIKNMCGFGSKHQASHD